MRALILAVALAFSHPGYSQPATLLKTELEGITLYRDQAELRFVGKAAVVSGVNTLQVRGIPIDVSRSSIRLQVTGAGVLMGFELSPASPDTSLWARRAAQLRDSLRSLRRLEARAEALLRVNGQERSIYLDNATLDPTRVTPEAVKLIATTTRTRLEALEAERGQQEAELARLRDEQRRLLSRIDSLRSIGARPTQQLSIAFSAAAAGQVQLSYSYLTPSARWVPEYVLDVPATGSSKFNLLARISNETGIDWKDQRLSFSTANPGRSSTPPEERKRTIPSVGVMNLSRNTQASSFTLLEMSSDAELGYIIGVVLQPNGAPLSGASISIIENASSRVVLGTYSDPYGRFKLGYPDQVSGSLSIRVSFIGRGSLNIPTIQSGRSYRIILADEDSELSDVVVTTNRANRRQRAAERDEAQSAHEFVRLDETELFRVFQLEQPVTLKGEGGSQTLSLASYALPLTRRHRAAPADDPDAFLVGEIRGWQALGLVSGPMRVTFEGSFVGQSRIDAREIADTVEVGLGRDSRVLVRRERDRQFTQRQFIGDRVRDRRAYSISVRNARRDSVELVLRDYVPVSLRDDITVELLETSGAEHQQDRGVLLWRLRLAPGESRELRFGYELRYPRSRYTIPLD